MRSDRSSPGDQIDDEHDKRNDQEKVNQAAGHVEAEPQDPQDQQDDENRPEHSRTPYRERSTVIQLLPLQPLDAASGGVHTHFYQ